MCRLLPREDRSAHVVSCCRQQPSVLGVWSSAPVCTRWSPGVVSVGQPLCWFPPPSQLSFTGRSWATTSLSYPPTGNTFFIRAKKTQCKRSVISECPREETQYRQLAVPVPVFHGSWEACLWEAGQVTVFKKCMQWYCRSQHAPSCRLMSTCGASSPVCGHAAFRMGTRAYIGNLQTM